jgi:hypothetical protein
MREKSGLFASTRSKVIAGVCALALVLGTGGVAWAVLGSPRGGAGSPEAMVTDSAQALTNLDVQALFQNVAPSESEHFKQGLSNFAALLDTRTESGEPFLNLSFEDIEMEVDPVIEGEVARVTLTRGKFTIDNSATEVAEAFYSLGPDGLLLRSLFATVPATTMQSMSSLSTEGAGSVQTVGAEREEELADAITDAIEDFTDEVPRDEFITGLSEEIDREPGFPLRARVDEIGEAVARDEKLTVLVVKEQGRWFISPLLTLAEWDGGVEALSETPKIASTTKTGTPVEAATEFCIMENTDPAGSAQFLPLAERRLLSLYPDYWARSILTSFCGVFESKDTDLNRVSTQAEGSTAYMVLPDDVYAWVGAPEDFPLVAVKEDGSWLFSPLATYGKGFETASVIAQEVAEQLQR